MASIEEKGVRHILVADKHQQEDTMRVAIIGAGKLPEDFSAHHEQEAFLHYLIGNKVTELSYGAGGGAPKKFCEFALNHGIRVFAASPWESEEAAVQSGDSQWIVDERVTCLYVGGAEVKDFGRRDFHTFAGCCEVYVLSWGKIGVGTLREICVACRNPNIKKIVFTDIEPPSPTLEEKKEFLDTFNLITLLHTNKTPHITWLVPL